MAEHFHAAAFQAFQATPELRGVCAQFDYEGRLNEVSAYRGIWVGRRGTVTQLDELIGSLHQTLEMLQFQINRLTLVGQQYAQQAAAAAQELVAATERLRAQDATVDAERPTVAA